VDRHLFTLVGTAIAVTALVVVLMPKASADKPKAKTHKPRFSKSDRAAKSATLAAALSLETCYTDTMTYAGCKASGAKIKDASREGYTVMARSASGHIFTIHKGRDGVSRSW